MRDEKDGKGRTPALNLVLVWATAPTHPQPWGCCPLPGLVLLPVVGEGVEVGHLHGAGIGLVGELVDQQPLLSLPDHAYLEKGETLGLSSLQGSHRVL